MIAEQYDYRMYYPSTLLSHYNRRNYIKLKVIFSKRPQNPTDFLARNFLDLISRCRDLKGQMILIYISFPNDDKQYYPFSKSKLLVEKYRQL